jgi:hypothetical protein
MIILTRFDERDNLVAELFKYNIFKTRLNKAKNVAAAIVPKESLINYYKINEHTLPDSNSKR